MSTTISLKLSKIDKVCLFKYTRREYKNQKYLSTEMKLLTPLQLLLLILLLPLSNRKYLLVFTLVRNMLAL